MSLTNIHFIFLYWLNFSSFYIFWKFRAVSIAPSPFRNFRECLDSLLVVKLWRTDFVLSQVNPLPGYYSGHRSCFFFIHQQQPEKPRILLPKFFLVCLLAIFPILLPSKTCRSLVYMPCPVLIFEVWRHFKTPISFLTNWMDYTDQQV